MTRRSTKSTPLTFAPAAPGRWGDIEALFGPRGACAGCWCMFWRRSRSDFHKNAGDRNKRALKKLIDGGAVPGIIAYAGDAPVGWCAIEPKQAYPSLQRSKAKHVDDRPCWSVTCFFVARPWRKRGVTGALLEAAVEHARKHGADLVEGYPIETKGEAVAFSSYLGIARVFRRAGFKEAARPSANHPVMRLPLAGKKA